MRAGNMKKGGKRRGVIALSAAALIALGVLAWFALRPAPLELPYLTARSVAVLDMGSGRYLYEKESDEPRPPASLTKLMTLLLVLDDVESGALDWEDTFTVMPEQAGTPGSKYGIRVGEVYTVRQLVAGVAMASGCDCVQCLVRLCAEDEDAFVARMNERAKELGLRGTHYVNATGIDAAEHYMTARDIAELARVLVDRHPELLDFTSQAELEVEGRTFRNLNRLAGRDPRVLGLKTGTTQIGGYNLVTCAEQDGRRCLIVLMDSSSDAARFSETETVLDAVYGRKS